MAAISGSLDTSALLRLVVGDIAHQTAAITELLADFSEVQVSDTAMIEMLFVLERFYKFPRPAVATMLGGLIETPKLKFDRQLFSLAISLYSEHSNWSPEDACLVAKAEIDQALPLWTFDQKLARQSDGRARLILG